MCLTYILLSRNSINAINLKLCPPISRIHHFFLCLKLSKEGKTFLSASGDLKSPFFKVEYTRLMAAASLGYRLDASTKGCFDITCMYSFLGADGMSIVHSFQNGNYVKKGSVRSLYINR